MKVLPKTTGEGRGPDQVRPCAHWLAALKVRALETQSRAWLPGKDVGVQRVPWLALVGLEFSSSPLGSRVLRAVWGPATQDRP